MIFTEKLRIQENIYDKVTLANGPDLNPSEIVSCSINFGPQ